MAWWRLAHSGSRGLGLALALLLAVASGAAAEDVILPLRTGDDMRGFEGVGRLLLSEKSFCTAALVAPDLALTAAHCVRGHAGGNRAWPLTFQIGLRDGRVETLRRGRDAVAHKDYAPDDAAGLARVSHDLGLIRLERPVMLTRVRPFVVGTRPVAPSTSVAIVSYARGRAEAPSLQPDCRVMVSTPRALVLDCEVDVGASGAPVFRLGKGAPELVAIVSASARNKEEGIAIAVPVADELDALLAMLGEKEKRLPGKRIRKDPEGTREGIRFLPPLPPATP